jgi:hypothetical protein
MFGVFLSLTKNSRLSQYLRGLGWEARCYDTGF